MHCERNAVPGVLSCWGSRLGLALLLAVSLLVMAHAGDDIAALRARANAGDAQAQFNLGVDYRWGFGVRQSATEAARWYRKAAHQGVAEAQYVLGILHENGSIGDRPDAAEAAHWYRKAADQGYVEAQYKLGLAYEDGSGVKKDATKMVHWYRKAADQGFAGAQFRLGFLYETGRVGDKPDAVEAAHWYQKAQVSRDAMNDASQMYDLAKDDPDRNQILDAVRKLHSATEHGRIKLVVRDLIKDGDAAYLCALIQIDGELLRNDESLAVEKWGLRKLAHGWEAVEVDTDFASKTLQADCRVWEREISSRNDIINAIAEAR